MKHYELVYGFLALVWLLSISGNNSFSLFLDYCTFFQYFASMASSFRVLFWILVDFMHIAVSVQTVPDCQWLTTIYYPSYPNLNQQTQCHTKGKGFLFALVYLLQTQSQQQEENSGELEEE